MKRRKKERENFVKLKEGFLLLLLLFLLGF